MTKEDIIAFEKTYKGSEEERADLKNAYIEQKGNMNEIMNAIMCSTIDDEERFREIIDDLINTKEVKAFKAYTNESKQRKARRRRKAEKEAAEAEEELKKLKKSEDDDLRSLILAKNAEREENFLKNLEEKYCGSKRRERKK